MKTKDNKPKISKASDMLEAKAQQRKDIQANITLLSGWQQAHKNESNSFVYGLAGQEYALHIKPGTKSWLILSDLIQAEITQAGADLILLGDA